MLYYRIKKKVRRMSKKGCDSQRKSIPDGIIAMLVTPFTKDFEFNYQATYDEIDWCAEQGAQGIVIAPSIGEFACLYRHEREKFFRVCASYARGRHPNLYLIAGTAGTWTREVHSYIETAIRYKYDAQQLIPPYYWIPDEEEVYEHYKQAAETGLPVIVYHNPKLSKVEMSAKFMGRLAKLPNVVGIKEVKTDRHLKLESLFKEVGGHAKVYTTFRAFTTGLVLGSNGGFINVFALPFCVKMWKMFQEHGWSSELEEIQNMVNEMFPRGGEDNQKHIGTTKMAASIVTGINMGAPRPPYKLPGENFEKTLREKLPALYELIA